MLIPHWAVDRWTRQLNTDYENLPEEEKDSDRKEADKFIKLFEAWNKRWHPTCESCNWLDGKDICVSPYETIDTNFYCAYHEERE